MIVERTDRTSKCFTKGEHYPVEYVDPEDGYYNMLDNDGDRLWANPKGFKIITPMVEDTDIKE